MATTTKSKNQLYTEGARIDANYGPWRSIQEYEAWKSGKGAKQIHNGTLIGIETADGTITDYIRSKGVWKKYGEGEGGGGGTPVTGVTIPTEDQAGASTGDVFKNENDEIELKKGSVSSDKLEEGLYRKVENRTYSKSDPNGYGYKVLDMDKTFAEQVTDECTVYEIRYDFDLYNGDVIIPHNCALIFAGGSIKRGTVNLNGCTINNMCGNTSNFTLKTQDDSGIYVCGCVIPTGCSTTDLPTENEIKCASKYGLTINLNYGSNTPSRYGALGDGVNDDSDAIQCCIDVVGNIIGEVDLRKRNNAGGCFKITRPIVIEVVGQPFSCQRITRIVGDNYQENRTNTGLGYASTIKAYNIGRLRGAFELMGYSNARDLSTSMEYVCIDTTDSSNDDLSFALYLRENKLNVFTRCRFVGKNCVLDLSGYNEEEGITDRGFSKIDMTWIGCSFWSTSAKRGYTICNGFYFDKGRQCGDNTKYLSCDFYGHAEIACGGMSFDNCQFLVDAHKDQMKAGSTASGGLGYATEGSWKEQGIVDYSSCISVFDVHDFLEIKNCYFEDYRVGVSFGVPVTESGNIHNYKINAIVSNCFFNGGVNSGYTEDDKTGADYAILINKCGKTNVRISGLSFYALDSFVYAPIGNLSRYPVYVDRCDYLYKNDPAKSYDMRNKCIGNIVFDNNENIEVPSVVVSATGISEVYNKMQDSKRGFSHIAVLLGPFSSAELADVQGYIRFNEPKFSEKDTVTKYPTFTLEDRNPIQVYMADEKKHRAISDGTNTILYFDSYDFANESFKDYSYTNNQFAWTECRTNLKLTLDTQKAVLVGKYIKVILCNDYLPDMTYEQALGMLQRDLIRIGATNKRPSSGLTKGLQYFDTSIGKPIWWNGTAWVDSTGEVIVTE